jgi:hypothetical protein
MAGQELLSLVERNWVERNPRLVLTIGEYDECEGCHKALEGNEGIVDNLGYLYCSQECVLNSVSVGHCTCSEINSGGDCPYCLEYYLD